MARLSLEGRSLLPAPQAPQLAQQRHHLVRNLLAGLSHVPQDFEHELLGQQVCHLRDEVRALLPLSFCGREAQELALELGGKMSDQRCQTPLDILPDGGLHVLKAAPDGEHL